MPKYKRLLGIAGASTVLGIAIYDSYRCLQFLRKPLSSNFMSKKSEYIYIKVRFVVITIDWFFNYFNN